LAGSSSAIATIDLQEWSELGRRLAAVNPLRLEELIVAMRAIVDAEEELALLRHDGSRGRA
jgi:hypothetical protein